MQSKIKQKAKKKKIYIYSLIKKHLPALHSDNDLKNISPEYSICAVFKRNRHHKEILSSSLYSKNKNEKRYFVIKTAKNVIPVKII